jgi:hypothetical protein
LLFSGSFGAVGAVWLNDDFFVGLSSQVTFTNQYSAVSSTVGNVRGSRWNPISPFMGWKVYSNLVFRTEFEFLGNYNLTNTTASGQSISYQSPIGVRVIVSSPIYKALSLGAVFEYISFSTVNNSSTGSQSLGVRTAMWCYGLQVGYAFEFFK